MQNAAFVGDGGIRFLFSQQSSGVFPSLLDTVLLGVYRGFHELLHHSEGVLTGKSARPWKEF